MLDIAAAELNEGGHDSRDWLKDRIENEEVEIKIRRSNRVGKFGRLLGEIIHQGLNINKESIMTGHSVPFADRKKGMIQNINQVIPLNAI